MRRLLLMTLILVTALTNEIALGCFRHRRICLQPYHPLTAESARRALVAMLERDDAPNFATRDREIAALRNGKHMLILEKHAEGILSGHWNCDLEQKTFWFVAPIGSYLFDYYGVFEQTDGCWRARVTGGWRAKLGPKDQD